MKTSAHFFDYEDAGIFHESEQLYRALTHLRYEGKARRLKNLNEVKRSIRALDIIFKRHKALQEKIIFPYLSTHIPRRQSAVRFLESDHEGLDRSGRKLKKNVRDFFSSDPVLTCGEIYEAGIFFIAHLRHHLSFEVRNIQPLVLGELCPEEKREMEGRIRGWAKKR